MIKAKVLIPVKNKTNIRGYWINDKNKLYRDNIKIYKINNKVVNNKYLECLRQDLKQEAIFYIKNKTGFIYNKNGITDKLPVNITIKHTGFRGLKNKIKQYLKQFRGLTVYKNGNIYTLEVYTNSGGF